MGDTAPDRNSAHSNGGETRFSLWSDELRLIFWESYEGNWVFNKASGVHLDSIVQSFQKSIHSLQIKIKGQSLSRFLLKCDLIQSTSQSSIITSGVLSRMVI